MTSATYHSGSSLHPHPPHWLKEEIGSLQELKLAVHSCIWIKVYNSDALVSFPPLGLGEYLCQLHFEVREHWDLKNTSMLFHNMLPEWFVFSLLFHICNIVAAPHEHVFSCLPCIQTFNVAVITHNTVNLVPYSCSSTQAL